MTILMIFLTGWFPRRKLECHSVCPSFVTVDFNGNPLPASCWSEQDASAGAGRVGMAEAQYIHGLYTLWDEIRQTHPNTVIDNCARYLLYLIVFSTKHTV